MLQVKVLLEIKNTRDTEGEDTAHTQKMLLVEGDMG